DKIIAEPMHFDEGDAVHEGAYRGGWGPMQWESRLSPASTRSKRLDLLDLPRAGS
ncbi:MAG: hypothetical protein ACI82H_001601, partial [Alphaproteobacteria bacterium]